MSEKALIEERFRFELAICEIFPNQRDVTGTSYEGCPMRSFNYGHQTVRVGLSIDKAARKVVDGFIAKFKEQFGAGPYDLELYWRERPFFEVFDEAELGEVCIMRLYFGIEGWTKIDADHSEVDWLVGFMPKRASVQPSEGAS